VATLFTIMHTSANFVYSEFITASNPEIKPYG